MSSLPMTKTAAPVFATVCSFFETEVTKLSVMLGMGYNRQRPEILLKDTAGKVIGRIKQDANSSGVGTAGLNFAHTLTTTTKILDKLQIEAGSLNTAIQNDLSLQVSMTNALALSIGYGVRYNTAPPGAQDSKTRSDGIFLRTTADVAFLTGIVSAGVGTYLLLSPDPSRPGVSGIVGPGYAGVRAVF